MSQPEGSHPEFLPQRIERVCAASIQVDGRRKAASMPATVTRWRNTLRAVVSKGTSGRMMQYAKTELARWSFQPAASTRPQALHFRIFSKSNATLRRVGVPDVRVPATPTLEFGERNLHRRARFPSHAPSCTSLEKIVCSRVRSHDLQFVLRRV